MRPQKDGIGLVSVVIPNYNYEKYVPEAVRSALNLDWPDVEVIVVDDGSTDRSVQVLAAFGSQIRLVTQVNAGQRVAYRRGYAESRGDVVIFLDSDDQLDPSIVDEASRVWHAGVSKVQVQMQKVDGEGNIKGGIFPRFRSTPTPEQIRHWMMTTSAYPTPPGSGNLYARWYLEQIFPLEASYPSAPIRGGTGGDADSVPLAAAPYFGEVVTIPKALVLYRVHGQNISKMAGRKGRLTHEIERAVERHLFAMRLRGCDKADRDGAVRVVRNGRHLLQLRVAEHRMCDGPAPLPGDNLRRLLRDTLGVVFAPGPERLSERIVGSAWCAAVLLSPAPVARRLVKWRFG